MNLNELTLNELKRLAYAYVVPTSPDGTKETTGKKALESVAKDTDDPVLNGVMTVRSLNSQINNFIPNWKPSSRDGCVHAKFNFTPPTGQLATRAPNIQNAGKHSDNGKRFRGIVEAKPGYVLIEFDYQRFHVATMGYAANDATYLRFAKLDSHSIFTSHLVGRPIDMRWSDADIVAATKEIKREFKVIRDTRSKATVLGNQLGLGARKLHWMNSEHISSEAEAKELQNLLAMMFPKVARFKDQIRDKAHKQTYLLNEWGRIQHFFDVWHFKYQKGKGWLRYPGNDSERAIAFPVQSPAHGMVADKLLTIDGNGMAEEYGLCNTIHDSVKFHCRKELAKQCVRDVYPILVEPCKVLTNEATGPEGLSVGVDINLGFIWRDMKEIALERFY